MYKLRLKLFSQNFLYKRKLVKKLVQSSSIGKNNLVLEIGPGKGILTEELVKRSKHVNAIEIDIRLCDYLQKKFKNIENFTLYHDDFLNFSLPFLPYKVFANTPFSVEGKIIRKLIDAKNSPEDCYLVMMKELAYRLAAPYKENMFSIIHKPWFNFSMYHHFKRSDFIPMPNVDVVMLRFTKRKNPLIPWDEKEKYQKFIKFGYGQGLPVIRNLKRKFEYNKILQIINKLSINKKSRPSNLSLKQWIEFYKGLFY